MFLGEHRAKPDRLSDLLPWAALVAPGVVLNKDGSFLRVIRFRGPDLDSATEPQVVVANAQLNNALKRLGGGWALFVEARRFHAADYLPEGSFPDPVSWLVDAERREAFEHEGQAFDTAYHLSLQYLPPTGRSFKCRMTAIFVFEEDRLVCERVYFDSATILRQLGIAHDPLTLRGRLATVANHPVTIGRALVRSVIGR